VKQYALGTDSRIAMYSPQTQWPARSLYVAIKTAADPGSLATAVKKEIREIDPGLPMYRTQTMPERVARSLAQQRFSMALLTLFAAVANTLAAIGVYGVMSCFVVQRTREIGIRVAIGATPGAVRGMVLRQGLAVALAGGLAGPAGALALARMMQSLLYGVGPNDPVTFLAVAITLFAVAAVATYLPARRAARVDPLISLRAE
jgi:ABC-type antimicrobial peptide transport system permease subunit